MCSTIAHWQKFWLEPVALVSATGFTARELRVIESIVSEHREHWKGIWNEYFKR
jgi:hypothetical protein